MRGRRGAAAAGLAGGTLAGDAADLAGDAVEGEPADTFVEFLPRRWRLLIRHLFWGVAWFGVFVALWATLAAVEAWPRHGAPDWLNYLLLGVCSIVGSRFGGGGWSIEDESVQVTGMSVNGPRAMAVWGPSWESIALTELDPVRSVRRSVIQRLFGLQCLCSNDGKRIRIQRWTFAPEDLYEMLASLGLEREQTRR